MTTTNYEKEEAISALTILKIYADKEFSKEIDVMVRRIKSMENKEDDTNTPR